MLVPGRAAGRELARLVRSLPLTGGRLAGFGLGGFACGNRMLARSPAPAETPVELLCAVRAPDVSLATSVFRVTIALAKPTRARNVVITHHKECCRIRSIGAGAGDIMPPSPPLSD